MPYRYVTEKMDYSDYSSGRVFQGAPGHPAFPIRLASEIFLACMGLRAKKGMHAPIVLYDPVCGGAYHLAILAFQHWASISSMICSDINPEILRIAKRNLSLLTLEGMDNRINELKEYIDTYRKVSHKDALASAFRLRQNLINNMAIHRIQTAVHQADALNPTSLQQVLGSTTVDIVIADVPYGIKSQWQIHDTTTSPFTEMLDCIFPFLSESATVAVAAGKQSTVNHPKYERVERFHIGKRKITILAPASHF